MTITSGGGGGPAVSLLPQPGRKQPTKTIIVAKEKPRRRRFIQGKPAGETKHGELDFGLMPRQAMTSGRLDASDQPSGDCAINHPTLVVFTAKTSYRKLVP
jgi:hypothetical protein